jgi:ubiquinone/menaquinone biosynthesis C-methylase UbiE
LDLTLDGLWDALRGQAEIVRRHLRRGDRGRLPEPGRIYRQVDLDTLGRPMDGLDELVRFEDGCFDKICCSLVLSYLKEPVELLKELHRILRPGGAIVVSSMKPFCDMSVIYRDFMEQQVGEEEIASGRQLLSAAGEIKVKEEYGVYQFYSGEELAESMKEAGFGKPVWENCFGNQAVAVMARK